MKRHLILSGFLGLNILAGSLLAHQVPLTASQAPQEEPKIIEVERLGDNLYALTGGGGTSVVFITRDNGVVVVDTKNPGWGKPLLAKIREITDKPVTTVINTHVHADHTGGNVDFPATATFIAHANTKKNMERLDLFKGDNARFVPSRTFQDKLSLFSGADRVDLYYFGRGGTDGDIWVAFPAHRVIAAGDAFSRKAVTNIDKPNGGNAGEFIQTLSRVVGDVKNIDSVVTGHAEVVKWSELVRYLQFNRDFQAWVRAQKQAGKTVDESAMAYKHPEQYSDYEVRPPMAIRVYMQAIYDEAQ